MTSTYGFLGVGSLAGFIVTGLCDGVDDPPDIVLSPRNAEVSARLAAAYPTVTVASDNQALLDASDVVLVLLRRAHSDVVRELTWRPDHIVVSAVAGLPVARLAELVAPAREVARAAAMPAVATRSSRTPVHPPVPAAIELFGRLGGVLPVEGGDEFEAIFTSMGTVAPFFEYLKVLADFLVAHGVGSDDAQRLVADTFVGAVGQLHGREHPDFSEIIRENAPPGGGNEQLTNLMREEDVFGAMARAVEEVHRRLAAG